MIPLNNLRDIPVAEIISKYTESDVYEGDTWIEVEPCPKCKHSGCCKINADTNTLACFSENKGCLNPVMVVEWLFDLKQQEAVVKLATDFSVTLPKDWEQVLEEHLKRVGKYQAFTAFAEECHERLNAEHRQYWRNRGFTDDFINKVKIGYCPGDGSVIAALQSKGFNREDLNSYYLALGNQEYYHYSNRQGEKGYYYTLPNWDGKRVIDIQGRCVITNGNPSGYIPKYRNSMGTVEALYNPRALKYEPVFIAEGVPDTLSLIQMGFNACGSYGVGGIKDEWIADFSAIRRVYVIFDNDDPGKESAYKLAKKIGDNARIVSLTEVNDVNEHLVKYGIEEGQLLLRQLVDQAKTVLEIDIESLPSKQDQVEEAIFTDLMVRIIDLPPLRQQHYRNLVQGHFGMTKKDVEELFRYYHRLKGDSHSANQDADASSVLLEEDPSYVRLAQSFNLGRAMYAQEFQANHEQDGKNYRKRSIQIVSSGRLLLPLPIKASKDANEIVVWKLEEGQLMLRRPLNTATRRWSKTGTPHSIDLFLKGEEGKVSITALYREIEQVFRKYYYTVDEYDYVILSLFTLFTYYYDLYDVVPYLYLNGQPETGKSTICILLQDLAFNGDMVSNISASALFREAEQKQLTLILDEQEGISSRKANEDKGDYLSVIKDAYKRTGTIKRQSPADASVTEEFMVFSPLVIANVLGLEDILKTRTIGIATKAAPSQAVTHLERLRPSTQAFQDEVQQIRDQCYCWVMQHHDELRKLPEQDFSSILNNRAEELFQPLFALATLIDRSNGSEGLDLVAKLTQALPNKLFRRASVQSRDTLELLRDACLELLAEQGVTEPGQEGKWISVLAILDKLVDLNDGRYDDYMTPRWIGEKIADANFISTAADKGRRNMQTLQRHSRTQLVLENALPDAVTRKVTHYFLRYERITRQTLPAQVDHEE